MDVRIGEVVSEIQVTEGVGGLSPDEVRKLATLIIEQMRGQQDAAAQRADDTTVQDRVFRGNR